MELSTTSINDLVKLGVVLWNKERELVETPARSSGLFHIMPIPANSGESREVSEIDLEQYASSKLESEQADRAKVQQGYSKTIKVGRVAKDIGISHEMRKYNKYPEVVSKLTSLAHLFTNKLELDLSLRLSYAASTSYTDAKGVTVTTTTGDGYQLAYAAHTINGSTTTFTNVVSGNPQLSKGAIEGAERLVTQETYNHHGEKVVGFLFDILFTTDDPNLVNTAREYLQATAELSAANSGVPNVYRGKFRHVVLPRLAMTAAGAPDSTKRLYWGIASSKLVKANGIKCGVWEEGYLKLPTPNGNAEEFSTDDVNFGVRGGYGIEALSGVAYKFSFPTAV
jgi:hypothetical protein